MTRNKVYKIVKKAWRVNLNNIYEGYLYSESWTWAISRNAARFQLLKDGQYNHVTYLTIPIQRAREYDLVVFEENEVKRNEIPRIIRKKERELKYNKILKDCNVEFCYIGKNGGYYRPNSCGYTDRIDRAGIYTKEEAVSIARGCDDINIKAVDVDCHNEMINKEIDELKLRLIIK